MKVEPHSCSTRCNSRNEAEDFDRLMLRYQQGSQQAAAQLIDKLSPRLLAYFAQGPHSHVQAEDMVQECWMRIHRARMTYRSGNSFLPWAFAIARHTRAEAFRQHYRNREYPVLDAEAVDTASQQEMTERAIEARNLLSRLPERHFEVVVLLKVYGLTLEEAALTMGCTVGSVKQRAHRAYKRLRLLADTVG